MPLNHIKMDTEENIRHKQLKDAAYSAIVHAGTPILLRDIYYYLKKEFPSQQWRRMTVHKALLDDERVGCFMRKGNEWYTIKADEDDWKLQQLSIHELVFYYLQKASDQKHISEIHNFVLKYHEIDISRLKLIIKVDLKWKCNQPEKDIYMLREDEFATRRVTIKKKGVI